MDKIPLNMRELRTICLADESTLIPEGSNYFYQDNGSSILAVAHCDYVSHGKIDFVSFKYKGTHSILCETLDDRLGVYLITKMLPAMGVVVDVLLTTDEEIGKSTAKDFKTEKQYNWMFSFDRRGTDIVCYRYRDKEFEDVLLKSTGKTFDFGSNSDITHLAHLGIKGLNFGCGYRYEHTEGCNANVKDITSGVGNFMSFYNANKDTLLTHTPPAPVKSYYYGGYEDGDWYGRGGFDADGYPIRGKVERPFGKDKQLSLPATKEKKKKKKYSWDVCDFCAKTDTKTRWDDSLIGRICPECDGVIMRLHDVKDGRKRVCLHCGKPEEEDGVVMQRIVMPTEYSDGKPTKRKRTIYMCEECLGTIDTEEFNAYAVEPEPILHVPNTGEDNAKT